MNAAPAYLTALVAAGQGETAPSSIGPGLIGFLATFGIVVAAILLFRSMTGHLRKVDHRARRGETVEQDERASESSLEDPGDDEEPDRAR
jgi:hypothetical protein